MTREKRRRRIIAQAAQPILQRIGEASWLDALALARWLVSELDSAIDLYEGETSDDEFRALLVQVFRDAIAISEDYSPIHGSMTVESYRERVDAIKDFQETIQDRLRGDYEVRAVLVEVIAALNELENQVTEAMYPATLRNPREQYRMLGRLGVLLLEFEKPIAIVVSRLSTVLPTVTTPPREAKSGRPGKPLKWS